MTDNLDTLSDGELDEVFAVEVANIPALFTLMKRGYYYRQNGNGYTSRIEEAWRVTEAVADQYVYPHDEPVTKHRLPHGEFSADANAVLPWLLKAFRFHAHGDAGEVTVQAEISATHWLIPQSTAPTFARAAAIALIRAKRAQKP